MKLTRGPPGSRCLRFQNDCAQPVHLSYNMGCNSDGSAGAPQCACTTGPVIASGGAVYWTIVDGDYVPDPPSWTPARLTSGLAVTASYAATQCAGTRVEFTAGNRGDASGQDATQEGA